MHRLFQLIISTSTERVWTGRKQEKKNRWEKHTGGGATKWNGNEIQSKKKSNFLFIAWRSKRSKGIASFHSQCPSDNCTNTGQPTHWSITEHTMPSQSEMRTFCRLFVCWGRRAPSSPAVPRMEICRNKLQLSFRLGHTRFPPLQT